MDGTKIGEQFKFSKCINQILLVHTMWLRLPVLFSSFRQSWFEYVKTREIPPRMHHELFLADFSLWRHKEEEKGFGKG